MTAACAEPRRVLILTAEVGEGHLAAGRALEEGLLDHPGVEVITLDGLGFLGRLAPRIIRDGYRRQLSAAPWTYNPMYRAWRSVKPLREVGRWVLYRAGRRRLHELEARLRPAVVVSTHPALTAALGGMRRRGELEATLCATIVDLAGDPLWVDRGVDRHLVMHPVQIPWVERHTGRRTAVAVLPLVAARFHAPRRPAIARAALGLPAQGSVVLVSGGGWGVGSLAEATEAACAVGAGTVIVLSGRNDRAAAALHARFDGDPRVRILGFVDHVDELMRAADVIVHGTGGMTSLEAIACGCPLIAFGTRLAHVREHDRTLARLGLCRVADDHHGLEAALTSALSGTLTSAVATTVVPSLDAAGAVLGALRAAEPHDPLVSTSWTARERASRLPEPSVTSPRATREVHSGAPRELSGAAPMSRPSATDTSTWTAKPMGAPRVTASRPSAVISGGRPAAPAAAHATALAHDPEWTASASNCVASPLQAKQSPASSGAAGPAGRRRASSQLSEIPAAGASSDCSATPEL